MINSQKTRTPPKTRAPPSFMLDANSYLKHFVERLTQLNRGRAFFTTPETLGSYVLVDFIEQKKAMSRRGNRRAG